MSGILLGTLVAFFAAVEFWQERKAPRRISD
jgi:hypothetical protein